MNNPTDDVFEKYKKILSKKTLSHYIREQTGRDQNIAIPINEAAELYDNLHAEVSDISQLHSFVVSGVNRIKELQNKRKEYFLINPNGAYQLNVLLKQEGFMSPPWLPETFREESNGNSRHRWTYYFNWSTVLPTYIYYNEQSSIELNIRRFALDSGFEEKGDDETYNNAFSENKDLQNLSAELSEQATSQSSSVKKKIAPVQTPKKTTHSLTKREESLNRSSAEIQVAPVALKEEPKDALNDDASVTPLSQVDVSERAKHSLLSARIYLALYTKAGEEQVPFSITIEEASELLKTPTCHFTDTALLKDETAIAEPSHITLTRLFPEKGFVLGNVVACTNHVNKLKSEMNPAKFEQTMGALKTLSASNMDMEQIKQLLSA